ncbi:hypothetical protein PVAND_002826 [Polypedilum vanderplanki]|uniref:VWFA domain-containing protein n=1 Tax=Polypedilum vanderplanki TaxID=319348 RepID=A0A9J6BSZ9_POLVA|nr:hypothetical protein PVAND_002826 [Polypedilum vanderplanki]
MKILLLALILVTNIVTSQRIRIPEILVSCYRGSSTEVFFPSSFGMVIDIIRKIERAYPTSIDLRHLSSRIFHDLRVDGIQRSLTAIESDEITAYSVTGFMTVKNRILQQVISNVSGDLRYQEILSHDELCMLHKLISSSVEPYERQNELRDCPWKILNTTTFESTLKAKMPAPFIPNRRFRNNHTIISPNFSRCPIENGVVFNDYGPIHPGIIITSIASGLQPQNIRINDFVSEYREKDPYQNLETMEETDNRQKIGKVISSLSSIDNTYAAGLVGDLAEVVLFQAPIVKHNFTIGFTSMWNDTYFPRLHYLNGSREGFFHLTDSEILSGIDGLFISQQVSAWSSRIQRLRLSQIFDMYYLHQGISIPIIQSSNNNNGNNFKGRPSTANRNNKNDDDEHNKNNEDDFSYTKIEGKKTTFKKAFNYKVLNEELLDIDINYLSRFSISEGINSVCHRQKIIDIIDVDKLKEETYNFIQILEFATQTPIISPPLLKELSESAVDQLMDYARNLISNNVQCSQQPINFQKSPIDLTLIIDGSRTYYENLQLINFVANTIGVSNFGSYISVVHGNNGQFIANRTNNIANLFEQLKNSSFDNPIRLSLKDSLGSIMLQMTNQTIEEKSSGSYMELSKVILVVSQSHSISELDFENAQIILKSSMLQFPDLYFVFLSNDIDTFIEMAAGTGDKRSSVARMLIENAERYSFIHASSTDLSTFKKPLESAFKLIPKRIISPFCRNADEKKSIQLIRDEFEDYATPNVDLFYRISPYYLLGSDEIRVRFQNVGYGDLTICVARHRNMTAKECKSIQDIDNAWFNITQPCNSDQLSDGCQSVYFTVQVDISFIRCTEYSCRFPDDVRFNVRAEGLRCEQNSSNSLFSSAKLNPIIFILILLHFSLLLHF